MKKSLFVSTAVVTALLGLAACSSTDRAATLPPGTYNNKTSTTDANGTTVDKNTTTDVSVDSNGNKQVTTKNKTSVDPKGLFNKSTTTNTNSATY